ncbi:hypothetical protein PHK61_17955 [Actinomycetospora lutea]|uniref:hypothetical protein n=1 Tax=Actinomycetospora lutea TaxID=663604 RepID=UPI0023671E1B|nr:hypothetical protein [Actinomycetospora lutea]MDD7940313.1 hypothetical protein [Actinomycetospora lutea]
MIKNSELALIPDSALGMLELPATSPAPAPRPSTARPSGAPRTAAARHPVRGPEPASR